MTTKATPPSQLGQRLMDPRPGSVLLRRLLPLVCLGAAVFGWLYQRGSFDLDGVSATTLIVTVSLITAVSALLLLCAQHLNTLHERLIVRVRLHAALQRCVQAVVNAQSWNVLVSEVCDEMVNGGFDLAWIGWLDTERRQIRPLAASGLLTERIRSTPVDLEADRLRGGPTSTALIKGTRCIITNSGSDAATLAFASDARALDLRSIAAFPIKNSHRSIGVLLVCSRQSQRFDEESAKLLEDLAADLGAAQQHLEAQEMRAETQALKSHLAAIVESSQDAIIGKDLKGVITSWNRGAELIFGYKADEMLGRLIRDLIPLERQPEEDRILQRIARGERVEHFDTVRLRKSGERVHLDVTVSPIFGADGRVVGASKIARDITRRVRGEHQAAETREQLRQLAGHLQSVREDERKHIALELQEQLGNTLTSIRDQLQGLHRQGAQAAANSPELEEALRQVDESMATVRRIAVDLRPPALDQLSLVTAVQDELRRFQARTHIPTHVELSPELPEVSAETATAIFRILQELLSNIARHASASEVTVSLFNGAEGLQLLVTDNGVGLSLNSPKASESLGLLSIQERALSIGGRLDVQGRSGQGTRVHLRLPPESLARASGA